jgi:hypothetical protein
MDILGHLLSLSKSVSETQVLFVGGSRRRVEHVGHEAEAQVRGRTGRGSGKLNLEWTLADRVARWFIFKPKIPI